MGALHKAELLSRHFKVERPVGPLDLTTNSGSTVEPVHVTVSIEGDKVAKRTFRREYMNSGGLATLC